MNQTVNNHIQMNIVFISLTLHFRMRHHNRQSNEPSYEQPHADEHCDNFPHSAFQDVPLQQTVKWTKLWTTTYRWTLCAFPSLCISGHAITTVKYQTMNNHMQMNIVCISLTLYFRTCHHNSQMNQTMNNHVQMNFQDVPPWPVMHSSVGLKSQLRFQKIDCFSLRQDFGLIKMRLCWACVPLFLWCRGQACHWFFHELQAPGEHKTRMLVTAFGLQGHHVLTEVSSHV